MGKRDVVWQPSDANQREQPSVAAAAAGVGSVRAARSAATPTRTHPKSHGLSAHFPSGQAPLPCWSSTSPVTAAEPIKLP